MSLSSEFWFWLILILLSFNYVFNNILEYLNDKNWNTKIPNSLKNFYKKKDYELAKKYKIEKSKLSFILNSFNFFLTFIVLYFQGFGYLNNLLNLKIENVFYQSLSFFFILFIINFIITLPFNIFSTFYIEEKYGFNRTSVKTFVIDKIKSIFIFIFISSLLIFIGSKIIEMLEKNFWILIWTSLSAFVIFLNMFYAKLIVPIFNKLTPLEDGSLKKKIKAYSNKVGYSIENIFLIDGSKRSTKANAFFSGLGPKKTIALYDTLVKNHSEEELVSVLAHEVGHYKKNHIFLNLVITIINLGIISFLFEQCMSLINLAIALGSDNMNFHLGILAFSFIYSPFSFISGVISNIISRKNEYEADNYAKETYGGKPLALALKKLSVSLLSNLYPHPTYVFFHYSHPPLLRRLEKLE
tara:strand:+ start:3721 stop:4956 length:1236 start_codon:yes stop_codon:yes gene_type:complete